MTQRNDAVYHRQLWLNHRVNPLQLWAQGDVGLIAILAPLGATGLAFLGFMLQVRDALLCFDLCCSFFRLRA
jgi:hypothetical protein